MILLGGHGANTNEAVADSVSWPGFGRCLIDRQVIGFSREGQASMTPLWMICLQPRCVLSMRSLLRNAMLATTEWWQATDELEYGVTQES